MELLVHASRAVSAMPDAVDTTVDYAASFLGINHLEISTFTAVGKVPDCASEPVLCRLLPVPMFPERCRGLCSGSLHCCMEHKAMLILVED